MIAETGPALQRTQDVARALDAIQVQVVVIGSAAHEIPHADFRIVTDGLPEVLAPIGNVVPLQWLAYFLSLRAGADADSFRTIEAPYELARSRGFWFEPKDPGKASPSTRHSSYDPGGA